FNSHIKVQQDWLPDMKITLGMAKTMRYDRCRTCHMGIDRTEAGNVPSFPHGEGKGEYAQPFSTHPRMDVYLSASSPHPLPEFGCTGCHDGQGSATSFTNASHTPNDPHQAHEWEHNHAWFNNHFWEYPMQPARLRESACLKCHQSVVELGQNTKFGATAPKIYEVWQLIKRYGCFGCHEINGFDAGKPVGPDLRLEPQTAEEAKKIADDPKAVAGTERKVGPSLRHVASKTTPEWLTYWTEEPKRFRPKTTMPQFFKLSNQTDEHGQKYSKVELAAIAHYLFDKSQSLKFDTPPKGYQPNEDRGKLFFAQKGCLACHSHDDERYKGAHADFAPNLSKVAAKIKPGNDGFQWVYTWIREPERHHPRTRMPDLFLDPEGQGDKLIDPAADIAAFLLK
ncbi:MAG TPA: c-type cytochrome, partial [Planctomycetaceae bacterium]|nr:c-type cytochrome [Planctomycetaceae bacterium]